jgi:hypothetical protein
LRKIFKGTKTEDERWKRKTIEEKKDLYRHSSIVQDTKTQRIRWLGHIGKMPEHRRAKRSLLEGGGKKRSEEKMIWE